MGSETEPTVTDEEAVAESRSVPLIGEWLEDSILETF